MTKRYNRYIFTITPEQLKNKKYMRDIVECFRNLRRCWVFNLQAWQALLVTPIVAEKHYKLLMIGARNRYLNKNKSLKNNGYRNVLVRLPDNIWRRLRELAYMNGISVEEYVSRIIEEHVRSFSDTAR